jgi:uncharacterized damage-inducible protein DinB
MSDLDLQYPIGKHQPSPNSSSEDRVAAIAVLEALPTQLAAAVHGLSDAQLETPYRPGGWTVRQVVHHVADSHMNAYARLRLALTEDWPTIFAYDQSAWAALPDTQSVPVAVSLQIIDGVHQRLVATLRGVPDADWPARGYMHPENGRQTLEQVLPHYAWHSRHHLAHVVNLRERQRW